MPGPGDIDPYEVLGLSRKADDVVIRAAWKALIRKHHPDSSAAADAAETAARINAAFKLLMTPEARRAYDRSVAVMPTPPRHPWARPAPSPPRPVPAPRRRGRRLRIFALAGITAALMGCVAFLAVDSDIALPAPVQRAAYGIVTDPSISRMRTNARRFLGLDTPRAYAAAPSGPVVDTAPPPVDEAGTATTAKNLLALSARDGAAAATEARTCIAETQAKPDWQRMDNCVALHIAGLGAADGVFGPPQPDMDYFKQATLALPERYAVLSDDSTMVAARIETIRKIVWAVMLRSLEVQLRARPVTRGD
ncbi:J domain-containing protein [Sphingomonas sp. R-74633]|uniref:J domain-containing protein n=1 Tax=Sphingomonas sp. R-74633 TaxID=2751188 RepID=UPI0015D1AE15|nr:J domain-containing protein [Sphingomonas sp. R-74633]NYT39250.1 J domain-containing protein [Sphingomonas sp. R-74633]